MKSPLIIFLSFRKSVLSIVKVNYETITHYRKLNSNNADSRTVMTTYLVCNNGMFLDVHQLLQLDTGMDLRSR